MSVLACDRKGCDNIMCDKLILNRSRYICWECWHELEEVARGWPDRMTKRELNNRVRDFIENCEKTESGDYETVGTMEELEKMGDDR